MTYCLKTILIVFLFLTLCLCRQTAFAWQQEYSSGQDSLADYAADEKTADEEEWSETTVQDTPSEEYYNYNEAHFYRAETLPDAVKRDIPDAEWKKMTNDPAFHYEDETEKKAEAPEYKQSALERMFQSIFEFLGSSAGKTIIIILVALIVLVLIIRAIQLNGNILFAKKDRKLGQEAIDSENHIPDDWENEIRTAAQAGNYRLALRYGYRYLLTMLQEKELIQFQVAKTNYQYVYELKGTSFHKPVMQLTREYEYAWYGGFEIEKPFFDHYLQMITTIKKELNY